MNTRNLNIDFSTWTRGKSFTAADLMCLYESDPIARFAIDGMIDDATKNWLKGFKEPFPEAPIAPKIATCMKFGDLFGDTIGVLLDEATDDGQITNTDLLKESFSGKASGLDYFYPFCDGDGYDDPGTTDLDELGRPKMFHVHAKGVSKAIDIDASRCVVFTGRKTRRSWRGICEFTSSIDDIVDFKKWRAAYGARASRVAVPSYHINKADGKGWSVEEKARLDLVFGPGSVMPTVGAVTLDTIGGALAPGEIDSVKLALMQVIADDLGVALNDIAEVSGNGEKFAPDSNQSTYWTAIICRQKRHEPAVQKVLKAFNITFGGWNSPWEESLASEINNINTLTTAYNNTSDPEIRSVVKAKLMTIYGEKIDYSKYLADERANNERGNEQFSSFLTARNTKGGAAGSDRTQQ